MYARIKDGHVAQYPYTAQQLFEDCPGIGFPAHLTAQVLAPFGVVIVVGTAKPEHDRISQSVVEALPVFSNERNRWEQSWTVIPAEADEVAQRTALLQRQIVDAVQQRLDGFAKTRGYDGILSACTYASSSVPKFRAEGQYCVNTRDAIWAKLYEMLNEVEAGTRPFPSGFQDIEPELPALAWPTP